MKNAPDRIWLQVGEDVEEGEDFNDCMEVTWEREKIFSSDIEYIRLDKVKKILWPENSEPKDWREIILNIGKGD